MSLISQTWHILSRDLPKCPAITCKYSFINLLNVIAILSQKWYNTFINATSDQFENQLMEDARWNIGKGSNTGHGTKNYFDASHVWAMWGWLFKCEKWWSFIVFLSREPWGLNVFGILINYALIRCIFISSSKQMLNLDDFILKLIQRKESVMSSQGVSLKHEE